MRIFVLSLFLTGLLMVSCSGNNGKHQNEQTYDLLIDGEWRIVETESPYKRFQNGLKFSSDNQVFYLDSQGHIIPPQHMHIFTLKGDTIEIVDHKYEAHVRYEKGTDIYRISKLTSDELVLEVLHPKSNKLFLKKF